MIHHLIGLYIPAVIGMLLISGCSDKDEPDMPGNDDDNPESIEFDAPLRGLPVFYVDITSDDCRFEVNSHLPVYFEWYDANPAVDFDLVENEDGKQYLVAKMRRAITGRFEVVTGRAYTEDVEGGFCRNIIIVVHDGREDTRISRSLAANTRSTDSPSGFRSCYSQYIGKSTRCYLQPGNEVRSVLLYENFFDENGHYSERDLTITTTDPTTYMMEFEGSSFSEVTKSWGMNIGISQNFKIDKKNQKLNGSFNLGIQEKSTTTEAKEYYLNLYGVKTAEVKLITDKYEYEEGGIMPDKKLFALLNPDFAEEIFCYDSDYFNANKFYDRWGTDIITQAVFGGYHLYLYGRQQNAYEHSVAVDAMASIKLNNSIDAKDIKDWVDVWKAKNASIGSYNLGFNYNNSEYHKSSKALTVEIAKGGAISYKNAGAWADGFKDDSSWALTGYKLGSDHDDDITKLYPIEQMAENMIYAYYLTFKDKLTTDDIKSFENAKRNLEKLVEAKKAYLESKIVAEPETKRLVVADMYMRRFDGIKDQGDALPFTAPDPTSKFAGNYLTYYPMMANIQAPCDHDYPFSAGRGDYASAVHYKDMIFYYALAPEDQCQGVVDVVFEDKVGNCPDGSYVFRGRDYDKDCAYIGTGMQNKKNRVFVKYYDESEGYKPEDKITAFAIVKKGNHPMSNDIYASTGGAERQPGFTANQLNKWRKFWDDDEGTGRGTLRCNKCVWFEGGGLIKPHDLWPAYTTKDLPIKQMTDKNVVHPKKY